MCSIRWPVLFAMLFVCAALAVVGCGGDSSDSSDNTNTNNPPASTNAPDPDPAPAPQELLNTTVTIPPGGDYASGMVQAPGYGHIKATVVTANASDVTAYLSIPPDATKYGETTGADLDLDVETQSETAWRINVHNPSGTPTEIGVSIVYEPGGA